MSDSGAPKQQGQGAGGSTQDNNTANVPGDQVGSSSGSNQQDNHSTQLAAAQSGPGFGPFNTDEDPVDSGTNSGSQERTLEQILEDEIDELQRGQDYNQPVQPSPLDFGSNQPQQPQETTNSSNMEGASSDSPPLDYGNAQDRDAENQESQNQQAQNKPKPQPILSVMNLKGEPDYERACFLQENVWMYMAENGSPPQIPDRDLRDPNNETAEEIQGGRIPSFMERGQHTGDEASEHHTEPECEGQDPSGEPYELHIEPAYAILKTHLERSAAKRLREAIRHDGLNIFSHTSWALHQNDSNKQTEPKFGRTDRGTSMHFSFVSLGNREGFNAALRKVGKLPLKRRPLLMIVQRDGGELRVEGLKHGRLKDSSGRYQIASFVNTLLDLFKQFEV